MKTEFFLDLCFVRKREMKGDFVEAIDQQMNTLFLGKKGHWHIVEKQEGLIDIIVAEINGIWSWESEEDVLTFLEQNASPQFWECLQGYQIRLEGKEELECSHCGSG